MAAQWSNLLYVVIPTLGNREHIERCAVGVFSAPFQMRIVFVDNGSDEETRTWLRQKAQDGIVVIQNERNLGVATAWNQGLRFAMANGAQAVLVCGSDTVLNPGALTRMVGLVQQGCAFVTGTQVPYDSPVTECPPLQAGDGLLLAPDFSCFLLPMPTVEALARYEAQHGVRQSPWDIGLFDTRFKPCLVPSTRVLTDDLTWVAIGDIRTGDGLVAVDEQPTIARASRSYRRAVVQAKRAFNADTLRIVLEDGRSLTCTPNHRWLAKGPDASGGPWGWRDAQRLKVGHRLCAPLAPWATERSYDAGWLAGIFDGEGCLRTGAGQKMRGVSFYQNEGVVLDQALRILAGMGIPYTTHRRKRDGGGVAVDVNRKEPMLRLLGSVRPVRLMQARAWEGMRIRTSGDIGLKIVAIEKAGTCEVVDLCTSTGTFIAEGVVSHNSYFEDNDYHHRLTQAGLVAVRDPLATFRHDCSLTIRSNPELAAENEISFRTNAQWFREKWGGLPHELPTPAGARPLNVTEEQWMLMTGGRPVEHVNPAQAAQAAREVYGRYGLIAPGR